MNRQQILALLAMASGEDAPPEEGLEPEHWVVLERFVMLVQQATPVSAVMNQAALDVLTERNRQVEQEQFTPSHDDAHRYGELSAAAACYALWAAAQSDQSEYWKRQYIQAAQLCWPWDREWWKPGVGAQDHGVLRVPDLRRDLVRAGALIQAAIEREDRCKAQSNTGDN